MKTILLKYWCLYPYFYTSNYPLPFYIVINLHILYNFNAQRKKIKGCNCSRKGYNCKKLYCSDE